LSSEEEENKVLARRFLEAFARGDLNTLDELIDPDFVDRSLLPGQDSSREGYKRSATEFYAAFFPTSPLSANFTIEDQIVQGDKVVTKFSMTSTHRSEFLGARPTGEVGTYSSIRIHRIVGGKIAEEWSEGNLLGVLLPSFEREIRERGRAEQELKVARSIQQASLPEAVPKIEGWQITPFYRPARDVGGDFYDFFELKDGRFGLVVGDATGKGVPAALVMSSARSMLRAVAQTSNSPGNVLRSVNDPLVTDIPPNMYVTCFYAILDPESSSLTYANAGHDLPYLRRRGGDCEALRARGMPLGLMPGMSYEEKEIMLGAGETALFYK
jgi:predicted ester cyclase